MQLINESMTETFKVLEPFLLSVRSGVYEYKCVSLKVP